MVIFVRRIRDVNYMTNEAASRGQLCYIFVQSSEHLTPPFRPRSQESGAPSFLMASSSLSATLFQPVRSFVTSSNNCALPILSPILLRRGHFAPGGIAWNVPLR